MEIQELISECAKLSIFQSNDSCSLMQTGVASRFLVSDTAPDNWKKCFVCYKVASLLFELLTRTQVPHGQLYITECRQDESNTLKHAEKKSV